VKRLVEPLGLQHTVLTADDAIRFRAAVGHLGQGADQHPADAWSLPRSSGPAGAVIASVADLLAFARLHLCGGATADGHQLLGAGSAAAMAQHQADLPPPLNGERSWGLGWCRYAWGDTTLIGHNGGTIGQQAFLRLLPERGLAIALLTNGGNSAELADEMLGAAFAELANVIMPDQPRPPKEPAVIDPTPYLGRYQRAGITIDVTVEDGLPALRAALDGELAALFPDDPQHIPLVARAPGRYLFREPGDQSWTPVDFFALADGTEYLFTGSRLTPRVG
jgi:CubicO group peptidase (beta-lactamase class C family)